MDNGRRPPLPRKPLRLWPGVLAAALLCLFRFVVPFVWPETMIFGLLGGAICSLAIIVWWALLSRAPGLERWGTLGLMVITLFATRPLLHESLAQAGQGILFFVYAVPALVLGLVAGATAGRRLSTGGRRATMVATILIASGVWILLRTGGVSGSGASDFAWRWSPTPEERLLAAADEDMARVSSTPPEGVAGADWPGFRGPHRNGIIRGVRIKTDWSASPPVELWRRPVGPGWSSFAVYGDLFYTQEQRGGDEVVAAYRLASGEPVWRHSDSARFWEANGGAGPRATPTVSNGRVYTFGATGIVNALDAADGTLLWSRSAAADTGAEAPFWGFSSSPLLVGDIVVISADDALVAYELASGDPRWFGPRPVGSESYSSPHLATIDGIEQILLISGAGAVGVAPADGTLHWQHPWPGSPIVQPALTADGDVLITIPGASGSLGMRRIGVAYASGRWSIEERWTSNRLKPFFNDFVIHNGHVYGFDGGILACIDIEDGTRQWKGGRYGHGQLVLLADQDVLLVLSERGELALVGATPDEFTELGRFPAIESKTWNHPALVGDILLVRNAQEMAAFRLALE